MENPEVRVIPYHTSGGADNGPNPRVETGAIQFGKDWPGLFIRGDNAAYLSFHLDEAIKILQQHATPGLVTMNLIAMRDLIWNDVINFKSDPTQGS